MRFSKEIKIALAAILGIALLFFGMNFLKGKALFSQDNLYFITFDDVSGLAISNPVYANGFKVGMVKDIRYNFQRAGDIVVELGVNKQMAIPQGTTAEIVSDFMGNVKMNLLLGEDKSLIVQPGDTIDGALSQGALAKAAEMIPQIQKILPKVDSIMASLNTILADPAIPQSLGNIKHVTADLTTSTKQLNSLLADLNKNVPGIMTKADQVMKNADSFTNNLASVDVEQTMKRVDQTVTNLQAVAEKLNNNKGSLGLLMNDADLYNNLNKTVKSADELLTNIREHPKRYVNISVFGKKDK